MAGRKLKEIAPYSIVQLPRGELGYTIPDPKGDPTISVGIVIVYPPSSGLSNRLVTVEAGLSVIHTPTSMAEAMITVMYSATERY